MRSSSNVLQKPDDGGTCLGIPTLITINGLDFILSARDSPRASGLEGTGIPCDNGPGYAQVKTAYR